MSNYSSGRGYTATAQPPETRVTSSGDRLWTYSDVDFIFKPSPFYSQQGLCGDIARKYEGDAIKQSVKNIILTNTYERPWKPNMGCNVRELLFEDMNSPIYFLRKYEVESRIENQLIKYESRIKIEDIIIKDHPDGHLVDISITYKLKPVTKESKVQEIVVKVAGERIR